MATLWGSICTILGYFSFQHLVTLNLFSRMQRSKENFFLDGVFCQAVIMTSLTLLPPGWRLTGFKWGGGPEGGEAGNEEVQGSERNSAVFYPLKLDYYLKRS